LGTGIVTLENLSKRFKTRRREPVEAIKDLSFGVAEGEFLSILGPSGAGKTTLLKIVAGLVPPSKGAVWVQGTPVDGPIQDFGMVFQNPVLLPWRTALQNVMLPIELLHSDRKDSRTKARELLALVGLDGFEDRRPHELSGGMQQRVALCRALIHDPAILLMDEPFGSLDELTRESLNDYLLRLWEAARKTVMFVTHSVSEAVYLSDRVAVLTPRPARLAGMVRIDLPRPRYPDMRYETEFASQVRAVQKRLRATV
jgi:NitT/TauT family transport system ATP-binding protein